MIFDFISAIAIMVSLEKAKENTMSKFTERTKGLMAEKSVTQKELAKVTGISESSISRYLSGELEPRMDILSNISRALGTTVSYLVGEDGKPNATQNPFAETLCVVTRNKSKLSDKEKAELIKVLFGGK